MESHIAHKEESFVSRHVFHEISWIETTALESYIANQKQHHASGHVFNRLEGTEFDEEEAGWKPG